MDLAQLRAAQQLEWRAFDQSWGDMAEAYFKRRRQVYEQKRLNRKSQLYGLILLFLTGMGDYLTALQ